MNRHDYKRLLYVVGSVVIMGICFLIAIWDDIPQFPKMMLVVISSINALLTTIYFSKEGK